MGRALVPVLGPRAAAVTFPLSFGDSLRNGGSDQARTSLLPWHRIFTFALAVRCAADLDILDVSALLVIAGVALALWRRGQDRGALAVQQFGADLLPLVLLFAVSITGLFLTLSTHLMRGVHFGFLSQLHAVTVVFTLLYLPFGKFFHIFQRPAQLGVAFYREAGARGEPARCARCGQAFASRMHVDDLKLIERELGIEYQDAELGLGNGQDGPSRLHYQDVCPPCRRKSLALMQDHLWSRGA